MSLKKTSTRKKSVTWQDVSEQSSKSAAVEATSLSSQIGNVKQRNHNTPIIQFQLHNIPFHFLGIVYYFLYVDYEKLVKYETINSVLYKALPLTYLGQIVWLSLLHVTPPVNEKKKHISAQKSKRIEFNPTLIFAATYLSFLSSFVIYAIAVLLGSPILVFQLQTYLLSLHLAFLVTFPLIVIYKFNSGHWISLIVDISDYMFLISNPIYVVALLSAVGAWSGVLTIPLDWDRDWQMYPISLVLGAYFGGFVGGIIAFFSGFLRESKLV